MRSHTKSYRKLIMPIFIVNSLQTKENFKSPCTLLNAYRNAKKAILYTPIKAEKAYFLAYPYDCY